MSAGGCFLLLTCFSVTSAAALHLPTPDIVERLLMAGYEVDSMAGPLADGSEGGSALHLAVAQGCSGVAALLLSSAANPRLLDFAARNALDLAALHGHFHLCPLLLEAGCWFTGSPGTAAVVAVGEQVAPGAADSHKKQQQEEEKEEEQLVRSMALIACLAASAPVEHHAFAEVEGTELVTDSFSLSFAECAARGECTQQSVKLDLL